MNRSYQIFDAMDRDKDGTITMEEFQKSLKKLGDSSFPFIMNAILNLIQLSVVAGIPVSPDETDRVTAKFSNSSGGIKYREFVRYG